MTALLFKLVGGIGLFLMGMVLLTDGLKAFAGDALRRWRTCVSTWRPDASRSFCCRCFCGLSGWRICHYLGPEDHSARPLTDASDHPDE